MLIVIALLASWVRVDWNSTCWANFELNEGTAGWKSEIRRIIYLILQHHTQKVCPAQARTVLVGQSSQESCSEVTHGKTMIIVDTTRNHGFQSMLRIEIVRVSLLVLEQLRKYIDNWYHSLYTVNLILYKLIILQIIIFDLLIFFFSKYLRSVSNQITKL